MATSKIDLCPVCGQAITYGEDGTIIYHHTVVNEMDTPDERMLCKASGCTLEQAVELIR